MSKSFFTTTEKYTQNAVQNLEEQPPLMAKLTKGAALLDEKVYEYLQQYAHGLLEFGALKPFSGAVDQSVFDKLFADFTLFNTALEQKSALFSFLPVDEVGDFTQLVSSKEYKKFSEVFGLASVY